MLNEKLVILLKTTYGFFQNSSSCLGEEDSNFAPTEGMFTVAQQVAHVAQTIDWFFDGMFNPAGFDTNWDEHMKEVLKTNSLTSARKWLKQAVDRAIETVGGKSDDELFQTLPEGPIMGGIPRVIVINSMADHTAHHRGALTVYSRLLGKMPEMPYGDS